MPPHTFTIGCQTCDSHGFDSRGLFGIFGLLRIQQQENKRIQTFWYCDVCFDLIQWHMKNWPVVKYLLQAQYSQLNNDILSIVKSKCFEIKNEKF